PGGRGAEDDDPTGELDVDAFATAIENFNRFYIRLLMLEKLSFTTLSALDTLACADGPLQLSELTRTEQITQSAIT
ncbi:hypothetical protein AB4Z54_47920, partial [Streptomyces sp. MCAF7]